MINDSFHYSLLFTAFLINLFLIKITNVLFFQGHFCAPECFASIAWWGKKKMQLMLVQNSAQLLTVISLDVVYVTLIFVLNSSIDRVCWALTLLLQ